MPKRHKRHRKPTSLSGVRVKQERAYRHGQELAAAISAISSNPYPTTVEFKDNGAKHVYKAKGASLITTAHAAMFGDFVHNLRGALDHLAHQLVLLNGGTPGARTQFPIVSELTEQCSHCGSTTPRTIYVAGRVSPDALRIIEDVQPRTGSHEGLHLAGIRDFDNRDKHRTLAVLVHGHHQVNSVALLGGPYQNALFEIHSPLEHDHKIVTVTYEGPVAEPNPDLKITPFVTFADGDSAELARWNGMWVDRVMAEMYEAVETVVSRCEGLFPASARRSANPAYFSSTLP